jgi:hypothetical protein
MVFFLLCAQSFYFLTCKLFPKRNSLVGEIEWRVANTCWCVCSFKRPTSYFYIFCQNRQTDKSPFLYGCETIYTVWEFNIANRVHAVAECRRVNVWYDIYALL